VRGYIVNVVCDYSIRPIFDAQLISVTSLPSGTGNDFVALGNKVYFIAIECTIFIGPTKKGLI
jgi:hypothetical protein